MSETSEQELERLRIELAAVKSKSESIGGPIECKVSPKGGVSVYRLGRFPTTLYRQQWVKLLEGKEMILKFIEDHDSELGLKPEDYKEKKAAERKAIEEKAAKEKE